MGYLSTSSSPCLFCSLNPPRVLWPGPRDEMCTMEVFQNPRQKEGKILVLGHGILRPEGRVVPWGTRTTTVSIYGVQDNPRLKRNSRSHAHDTWLWYKGGPRGLVSKRITRSCLWTWLTFKYSGCINLVVWSTMNRRLRKYHVSPKIIVLNRRTTLLSTTTRTQSLVLDPKNWD